MNNKLVVMRIISFFTNYIKYALLTVLVIFPFVIILFILSNINPDFSIHFFKYFKFLNPIFGDENMNIDKKDIMKIFFFISLIFWLVVTIFKYIIKRLFNLNIKLKIKHIIWLVLIPTTLIYVYAFVLINNHSLDKEFYLIFTIVYIINIIFIPIYLFFNNFINKILALN